MGKASKWLRSLLTGKTSPDDKKEKAEASLSPPLPTQLPVAKEKKRWRFRRPTVAGSSISTLGGDQTPEAESARTRQAMAVVAATAAAAEAAFAAAQAVAAVVRFTAGSSHQKAEEVAATRIQSAFRGYLARKALCALRGLVKLQALVRGHLIRKQAAAAAAARCCMQALLMKAHERAQSHTIQMAEGSPIILQRKSFHRRSSPQHPRSRHSHASPIHASDRNAEDIKIVEMDLGASRGSSSTKSRNSYSLTQSSSGYCGHAATPSKVDQFPEFSPCDRAQGEHLEEDFAAFSKAQSSPYYLSSISVPDAAQMPCDCHFFVPSYMADTESSRAKARSQSAPRQRTDAFGRQTSRRRPSVEGRNTPVSAKMHPFSSRVDMVAAMPLKESECGSTSTVLMMNTNYGRSSVFDKSKHQTKVELVPDFL